MADLTEDEKLDLESMEDDELYIQLESSVRIRKKAREDKKAYAKAANDLMKLHEAKMEHAAEVLHQRQQEALSPSVPPSPPPAH